MAVVLLLYIPVLCVVIDYPVLVLFRRFTKNGIQVSLTRNTILEMKNEEARKR